MHMCPGQVDELGRTCLQAGSGSRARLVVVLAGRRVGSRRGAPLMRSWPGRGHRECQCVLKNAAAAGLLHGRACA